jgi:hypothetical protein
MRKAVKVFDKHFPKGEKHPFYYRVVFAKHYGKQADPEWRGIEDAAYKFELIAIKQSPVVYKRKADLDALAQFSKAITALEYCLKGGLLSNSAFKRLQQRIHYGPHAADMPCDSPQDLSEYLMEAGITDATADSDEGSLRHYIEKYGDPQLAAIEGLLSVAPELKKAITQTKADIEISPRTKDAPSQIKMNGVQFVEAARIVWEENMGATAPNKDLNAASAFGRFLADLFEAYGIEGEPKSAFRAWVRLNKNNPT